MPIPTTLESLSVTAASNGPAGSEDRSTADDGLRQAYAFIRQSVTLGSNIASASSITPPSTGSVFNITGTTTITAIASTNSWDGRLVTFIFAGALTLTHSATLPLPGSLSITTAANDVATFLQTASGTWRCVAYERSNGGALLNGNVVVAAPSSGNTLAATALTTGYAFTGATSSNSNTWGIRLAGGAVDLLQITGVNGSVSKVQIGPQANAGTGAYWEMGSDGSANLYARTTGTLALSAGVNGNVTIAAPSSGYALNTPLATPASAAAAGTQGDIAWDANYIYVCTATNTWKRTAITTW